MKSLSLKMDKYYQINIKKEINYEVFLKNNL